MSLQAEIDSKAKEIHSDSYSMSIGEISTLYKDEELDIHPDFQRIYRWNNTQKTKLIESLLLGIPIPSIFVAQREDGVWDVIDGLQRLSTIFEFMGILKDENGNLISPLKLEKTEYLPSLEGCYWDKNQDDQNSFDQTQRLLIKRAKLDIQIVKRESDKEAKYELFQRLNTGGSKLSDQEVRNCLLVMIDKEKFIWLKKLASNTDFQNCISITERAQNEAYDHELVLRYIIYRNTDATEISRSTDLGDLITKKMIEFIEKKNVDFDIEEQSFSKTFKLLSDTLGEDAFRKYDSKEHKFKGPFSISAFEAIIPGLSKNVESFSSTKLEEKIKKMWGNVEFSAHSGAGLRAADRVKHLFPLSEILFQDEN